METEVITNCEKCGIEICATTSPVVSDYHLCHDCYFNEMKWVQWN